MLREGAEGPRDGAGDSVAVEGDSEEVGERREGGRECAGEGVVGEINGYKGFHLGQEIGYLARDVGVGDVEKTEFGEFGDGGGDRTDEVVDARNVEKTEVGEVGDGGRDRVGFGEAKVVEVEAVDAVCFGVDVAWDTFPFRFAAVGVWEPGGEGGWVAEVFLDLEKGFLVLWVA